MRERRGVIRAQVEEKPHNQQIMRWPALHTLWVTTLCTSQLVSQSEFLFLIFVTVTLSSITQLCLWILSKQSFNPYDPDPGIIIVWSWSWHHYHLYPRWRRRRLYTLSERLSCSQMRSLPLPKSSSPLSSSSSSSVPLPIAFIGHCRDFEQDKGITPPPR